ncbi:hypothetical protein WDL1CHR_03067 [Variovorax sp. WDL1]|nr:hypothetical protein [Variovorax sp. WDL1]PNG58513.1 hypothetical protein CHC07_00238 [Variovorax sp. B4]PNG61697.1 hypothetical protein CHC06_01598 [Variovorax sp. B2]VTV12255.1 hypothetical protein WDL1CHR_03067 [Variovorax sp. WDL1]
MRQTTRARAGTTASTTEDRPSPIWPEPGQIHVQIIDLLGVEAKRTRLPGLRLTLPGDADHERQLAFEECCSKMAEALGSPQMVEELVARDGDQLLIHTVPFAGWWLMKKFAQEHEVNDVTHYLDAVDPGMSALIDGFLQTASEAWDGVVASRIDRHGSVPDISMDDFLPPSMNRDVGKPEFDAWFLHIAQSKKSFYLAERHGNHGARNLFIENASHLSGYELQTEMFNVEDQPLIDRFLVAGSASPFDDQFAKSRRSPEGSEAARDHCHCHQQRSGERVQVAAAD